MRPSKPVSWQSRKAGIQAGPDDCSQARSDKHLRPRILTTEAMLAKRQGSQRREERPGREMRAVRQADEAR